MTLAVAGPVTIRGPFSVASPARLPVLTVSADGQRVWVGTGLPTVVPGSSPNDLYLDDDTGYLYRLI